MNSQIQEPGIRDYLTALRRRKGMFVAVAATVMAGSLVLALLLPTMYRAQAVVLIEQQEIPSDLVRSTVTSYADQRIQVISQRVMTSANLLEIMEKYSLYEQEREGQTREAILDSMRDDISIEMISADVVDPRSGRPTQATIAFQLSFESEEPGIAQRVTNELVTLYLNENIKRRTESAEETASFLTDEAERLAAKVAELEDRLVVFKEENVENRPELEDLTRQVMNRLELELLEIERKQDAIRQQRIYLEGELAQLEPYRMYEPGGGLTAADRLRAIEAELATAEASYGSAHPDVMRLRKQAEGLRAEVDPNASRAILEEQLANKREEFAVLSERYGPDHPDVRSASRVIDTLQKKLAALPEHVDTRPTNPNYLSLQARLQGLNFELKSLDDKRAQLQARYDDQVANLMKIPEAEAEYRKLAREYENSVSKYQEISAKQMEARLSQNLEAERKGERFTLIEPPLMPEEPHSPNRTAIFFIGFLVAAGAGLGSVGVAEALDTRIRGRRDIVALTGAPPLAAIPVIQNVATAGQSRRLYVATGLVAMFVLTLAAVHLFVEPLDVIWYVALRRVGF